MSFIDKLKSAFQIKKQSTEIPLNPDSYADNLILELRRAINDAVITELEKNEEKYLSTILRSSHFPIEAISIIPCDHETAKSIDEFFRIHTELDQNFKHNFFINNFPKEYRTSKGAKSKLNIGISFNIQPSKLGNDNLTTDEEYQINLRGNRKKFTSIVDIGKITTDKIENTNNFFTYDNQILPQKDLSSSLSLQTKLSKDNETNIISESYYQTTDKIKETIAGSFPILNISSKIKVSINILDKKGEREIKAFLPLILGRSSEFDIESQYQKINIDSTYISRNQFVIFEVNNTVYGFVPKEAKVTATLGRRGTLRPLSLIEIENRGLHMTFGQPLDTAITVVNSESPDLYPSVTIKLDEKNSNETMTPVPNIRK